ncbi:MAG: hypothetical protein LC808_10180 [Actinobacteria bacterium]|nr:hypothetical protein [Actinomycetota bacterium]
MFAGCGGSDSGSDDVAAHSTRTVDTVGVSEPVIDDRFAIAVAQVAMFAPAPS